MKNTLIALIVVFGLYTANAAQTNAVAPSTEAGKQSGSWELTLGGGGETFQGQHSLGLDVSLSTNPFKVRPEVWVGVAQGVYWEPTFSGSTDVFVDWSQPILPAMLNDSLYLTVGWSGGALYENVEGSETIWRTGPEATLQYYTSDNSFIYLGVNYDVFKSDGNKGEFRYSFGIGLTF